MESRSDRLLKRVWLVNGFLLLALGLAGLALMLTLLVSDLASGNGDPVRATGEANPDSAVPRAVRYGSPRAVRGTETRLVTVHHGEGELPEGGYASGGSLSGRSRNMYSGDAEGPIVNVAFLTPGEDAGRLLLDRPAVVTDLRYPRSGRVVYSPDEGDADSLQTWISYEIVDGDTNRDGRLDGRDRSGLFVSALDGSGLRRVLPERYSVLSHGPTDDGLGILVLALEPPRGEKQVPSEQMRQRAFVYDVRTGELHPHVALEALTDRAARIVGR